MKQNIVIVLGRRKRFIQCLLCLVSLLLDEFATHRVRCSQVADGLRSRKGLNADVLTNIRGEAGGNGTGWVHGGDRVIRRDENPVLDGLITPKCHPVFNHPQMKPIEARLQRHPSLPK